MSAGARPCHAAKSCDASDLPGGRSQRPLRRLAMAPTCRLHVPGAEAQPTVRASWCRDAPARPNSRRLADVASHRRASLRSALAAANPPQAQRRVLAAAADQPHCPRPERHHDAVPPPPQRPASNFSDCLSSIPWTPQDTRLPPNGTPTSHAAQRSATGMTRAAANGSTVSSQGCEHASATPPSPCLNVPAAPAQPAPRPTFADSASLAAVPGVDESLRLRSRG